MKKYFYLQIKRVKKTLPIILAVVLLLCISASIIFTSMIKLDSSDADKQKLSIGIVGDNEDYLFNIGIKALETFDSSRFAIEFSQMDEDSAKKALQSGDLTAYVVIPDGFIDSAMCGEIKKIQYCTTNDSEGIATVFEQELTEVISDVLVHSQKGVYGMEKAMTDNGVDSNVIKRMNELCVKYINLIINRTDLSNVETIGVANGITLQGYFLCAVFVMFMFMFGISCISIYVKEDMSLNRIMAANGENALKQIVCEYSAYFLLMFSVTVIFFSLFTMFDGVKLLIPELQYFGTDELLTIIVKLIPLIAMISAYHFLLFELSHNIVSGALLQFVTSVSLTYIAGCFYPIYFFPDSVQKLSTVLPGGTARGYFCECISQAPPYFNLIAISVYFALFFGLTVFARNRRIKGRK